MDEVLECLSAQEKEIASVGTTVVQTEQLLKDLDTLDKQAEVIKKKKMKAHFNGMEITECMDLLYLLTRIVVAEKSNSKTRSII